MPLYLLSVYGWSNERNEKGNEENGSEIFRRKWE